MINTRIINNDAGAATIVGLMRNNAQGAAMLTAKAKVHANGGVVDDAPDDNIAYICLGNGGIAPFVMHTQNPLPAGATVELLVDANNNYDPAALQLVSYHLKNNAAGTPTITGIIRNAGNDTAWFVGAGIAFFRTDGTVLYVYENRLDNDPGASSYLHAGVQAGFTLSPVSIPPGTAFYQIYMGGGYVK